MLKRHAAFNPDEVIVAHSSDSSRSIGVTDRISKTSLDNFGVAKYTYPAYSGSP